MEKYIPFNKFWRAKVQAKLDELDTDEGHGYPVKLERIGG